MIGSAGVTLVLRVRHVQGNEVRDTVIVSRLREAGPRHRIGSPSVEVWEILEHDRLPVLRVLHVQVRG